HILSGVFHASADSLSPSRRFGIYYLPLLFEKGTGSVRVADRLKSLSNGSGFLSEDSRLARSRTARKSECGSQTGTRALIHSRQPAAPRLNQPRASRLSLSATHSSQLYERSRSPQRTDP